MGKNGDIPRQIEFFPVRAVLDGCKRLYRAILHRPAPDRPYRLLHLLLANDVFGLSVNADNVRYRRAARAHP